MCISVFPSMCPFDSETMSNEDFWPIKMFLTCKTKMILYINIIFVRVLCAFFLGISATRRSSEYEGKPKLFLFRLNKDKSTRPVSGLLDLSYIHKKLKQTLARIYFSFLWNYRRSKKLETCQVGKLAQHCENVSNPSLEL